MEPWGSVRSTLRTYGLRNVSLVGRILSLIKSDYRGWLSMMTSSEGPLFNLASGTPNPKPVVLKLFGSWATFVFQKPFAGHKN